MDLGIKGCKYTWSNNRKYRSNLIMERLDKIFSNDSWINLFPKASVIHLPKTYLDHNPILLELIPKVNNLNSKLLRLESFWCGHPEFSTIVNNCWLDNDFTTASNIFKDMILIWKNDTFGDIFRKEKRLLARLNGIQNSNAYSYSHFLHELEDFLKREFNNCLKMEEDYWKLRARVKWLNEGDSNSKIFHLTATNKRRTNKIVYLRTQMEIGLMIHQK